MALAVAVLYYALEVNPDNLRPDLKPRAASGQAPVTPAGPGSLSPLSSYAAVRQLRPASPFTAAGAIFAP